LKEKVETFLKAFKNINHYVCANNKLYHYNGLISTTLNKLNIDSLERLIDSVEKPTIAKQPIPSNTQATTQNNFKPTTTTLAKPLKPNTQNAPSASTNRKAITEANKGEAPYIMGKVYADLKNYAKAKELFQKALQFNYKPQDVYKQLMAIEIETNNKAEALSLYQNATAQYGSAPFKIEWIKINAMDDKK
jgi:tetratricopeptide (TPR) repeat protein